MKASVERLRWGLAGAAVLLLLVLAGFLGYGRYKARKIWQGIVARSGIHITHETDGFTYSQSLKGHTVFTLHAAKAIQHGDGKWTLHDVVVTLYGKTGTSEDHIYGKDIEYDEKTGVATAIGEVHMDLQVPGALANGKARAPQPFPTQMPGKDEPESDHIIHVRTSGLVYVRKLAVAATDQMVEFRYAGLQCTAKGAEFDSGESFLHLLADVVMTGNVRNEPMIVHAVKADLNRTDNTVALVKPVAQSHGRTVSAASALIHLRNDGSVEQAQAGGGVVLDTGTRHLTAANFEGTFGKTSLPVTSKLNGDVLMTDSNAARPMRAQANEVDSTYDAAGNPATVLAAGAAQVVFSDRKPGVPELARAMQGDRILGTFTPVKVASGKAGAEKMTSRLSELHAMGSAMARGNSIAGPNGIPAAVTPHVPELKSTQVFADDLRALLEPDAAKGVQLRQVFGTGHTRLEQSAPQGEKQTSSGDSLVVEFAMRPSAGGQSLQVASATQAGSVTIHSVPAMRPDAKAAEPPVDAGGDRAVFDGATSKLTLTGGAHFMQGDTDLTAATIAVDQHSGDAEADGGVMATVASGSGANGKSAPLADAQRTHVSADHARLIRAAQLAEFTGTEAHPARLWQGASQVQAADLLFDQKKRSLAARPGAGGGLVHAVFADAGTAKPTGPKSKRQGEDKIVRVVSTAMDYDDVNREATFSGDVKVDGSTGQARSQRGVVFLTPAQAGSVAATTQPTPFGGSVRRVVLSGEVKIAQPGRTGTGDQLVYTAADSAFVFTGTPGKPPRMVDAQQGSVTGATLLFHTGDSTIVVAGKQPESKLEKPGRVRSETEVRQ